MLVVEDERHSYAPVITSLIDNFNLLYLASQHLCCLISQKTCSSVIIIISTRRCHWSLILVDQVFRETKRELCLWYCALMWTGSCCLFWIPDKVPAVSLKIVVKQKKLRAGDTIMVECLAGSSNPKVNITWSLGTTRCSILYSSYSVRSFFLKLYYDTKI